MEERHDLWVWLDKEKAYSEDSFYLFSLSLIVPKLVSDAVKLETFT